MVSPLDVVAGSATPPASQSQSPFFQTFPPEIRRTIYDYCAYDYFADNDAEPALLKACKRTALEATAPMQKYARVTLLFRYDVCPDLIADMFGPLLEDSTREGETPADTDGVPNRAEGESSNDNDESADEDTLGESGTRFFGVHNFPSADMTKVEHVFIDLVVTMAKAYDGEDLFLYLNWDIVMGFAMEELFFYLNFTPGMPMLDAFALSHGWDIKSVSVDLGPGFDEPLLDRRSKFNFVKDFLEDGFISRVDKIPLFDRLVQKKAINFEGLTFSPFPIIDNLNDPNGCEDEGGEGYESFLVNVVGIEDPRFMAEMNRRMAERS